MSFTINISADAASRQRQAGLQLAKAYSFVGDMESVVAQAHRANRINGFLYTSQKDETVSMSCVDINIAYENVSENNLMGGGLIIELGDYEFLVLAINCTIDFKANTEQSYLLDLLVKEEGRCINGEWKRGRILNGDERYRNVFGNEVSLVRFKLFPYAE